MSIKKKQDTNDSVVALVERATIAEKIYKKVDSIARLEERDTAAVKKQLKKSTVINKRKQEKLQTVSATIWSDEQIDFLNQVEKILLFSVRITDIGSRKLELDSQLNPSDQEVFIQVLLHPESYPDTSLVESSNGKKFEPDYQMLLEAGNEKLTLMFDVEGLYMMVANLYGREKYAITPSLMEQVENLKKKQ